MHFMSLRGKRDFRLTWQSRGSALGLTASQFYFLHNFSIAIL